MEDRERPFVPGLQEKQKLFNSIAQNIQIICAGRLKNQASHDTLCLR